MNVKQRQQRRQRIQARVADRRARRDARRAEAQARFTGPFTPKQARRVARSQTRIEYKPLERQITSEIRGSKKWEDEIGQWYGQLGRDFEQGQAAAQTAFDTAEKATDDRLAGQAESFQQTMQGLAAANADFAKLTGAPSTGSAIPAQAEVAAAAERTRVALQAPVTQMRASGVAAYTPRRNAVGLAGIQARQEESARRRTKQQDLRALKQEEGSATVKNLQVLREQDQNKSTQDAALGVKAGYNRAIVKQAREGTKQAKITAAAQIAAAQAYSKAKERGASAQEAAAQAYSAAKRRGASSQEAVAAENRAASEYKADRNVDVAKQQGRNAAKADTGGYSVGEAAKLVRASGQAFASPGDAVQYLVNRGVKEDTAKKAVHRVYAAAKAGR